METRQISQVKTYILMLNPKQDNPDAAYIVAVSTDYDKLVEWYNSMLSTEQSTQFFAEESPLAPFNPAQSVALGEAEPSGAGIHIEWINDYIFKDMNRRYRMI